MTYKPKLVICSHATKSSECLFGCEHVEPHVAIGGCDKKLIHCDGYKVRCTPIKAEDKK